MGLLAADGSRSMDLLQRCRKEGPEKLADDFENIVLSLADALAAEQIPEAEDPVVLFSESGPKVQATQSSTGDLEAIPADQLLSLLGTQEAAVQSGQQQAFADALQVNILRE